MPIVSSKPGIPKFPHVRFFVQFLSFHWEELNNKWTPYVQVGISKYCVVFFYSSLLIFITASNMLITLNITLESANISVAPVCRRTKPLTVAVSREQTVTLRCQVEADPKIVNFRWTLSTGRETALVTRDGASDTGLSSILEYTPRRETEFGQLQCWAMNDIGKQREPCLFNIVKEGT